MEIETGYCEHCERVRVERQRFNTMPHMVLAVITLGLWIPFWLLAAFCWPRPWRCMSCGAKVRAVGAGRVDEAERIYEQLTAPGFCTRCGSALRAPGTPCTSCGFTR